MITSYCKVNLILKVYPKKKGETKHKIQSLFILDKNNFDTIDIKPATKDKIEYFVNNNKIQIANCLVKKCLAYLKDKFAINKRYKIRINKKIDIMSGLGGGSSNAGNIIKYILKDNKISITKLNMKEIALTLGSDIPFFLYDYSAAIVSEYGNKVVKFKKLLPIKHKLVLTNINVSTKKVFDKLDLDREYKSKVDFKMCLNTLLKNNFNNHYIYNDLQSYIFKVSPKLKNKFASLNNKNKFVCGSGGTIIELD